MVTFAPKAVVSPLLTFHCVGQHCPVPPTYGITALDIAVMTHVVL